jgi:NAD(P)H-hydrate repair Nnr-like enzyme with NAD(P)H-hydrate dehydratase domain
VLLTPHAGEMAHLCAADKQTVLAHRDDAARQAARRWNALVALKGATTMIAAPDGRLWRHEGGNIGLAASGSGDTLSGIIAGLAARGAPLEQACAWGVALHARAGEALAQRYGLLGYLPRELAAQVPAIMHALGGADTE